MYHKSEGPAFCYVNSYKIFISLNNWCTILWQSFEPTVAEWHFLWSRRSTTKPPRLDTHVHCRFFFKVHGTNESSSDDSKLCPDCGAIFQSASSYNLHRYLKWNAIPGNYKGLKCLKLDLFQISARKDVFELNVFLRKRNNYYFLNFPIFFQSIKQ